MITPKDIENTKRKSGFNHVAVKMRGVGPSPFSAEVYSGGRGSRVDRSQAGLTWRGPRRSTALEAAQDYCDYVNGNPQAVQAAPYAAPTVDLGVSVHRARGKKRKGAPFVDSKFDLYDVDMVDPITDTLLRRKVGITASGDGRYSGVAATFGISFRARAKGVTFPNKAAAEAAERALVATIEKDPEWVKVGKECFAPARKENA